MDIFIPIGIGFLVNLGIFFIAKAFKQTKGKSLLISFVAFLIVLLSSFMIGAWVGMGIAVISIGMLLFVILVSILLVFLQVCVRK